MLFAAHKAAKNFRFPVRTMLTTVAPSPESGGAPFRPLCPAYPSLYLARAGTHSRPIAGRKVAQERFSEDVFAIPTQRRPKNLQTELLSLGFFARLQKAAISHRVQASQN